jgi:hypothetical protein
MITSFYKYKLYENPDSINLIDPNQEDFHEVIAKMNDVDAYPFGIFNGKMRVAKGTSHKFLLPEIESPKDNYRSSLFKYPGRIWINKKLISFWTYPPKEEMEDVIIELENAFRDDLGMNIIIWDDIDYKIDVYIGGKNSLSKLVPLRKYIGSDKRTSQELRMQHAMSPLLKGKKVSYWKPKHYIPLEWRQKIYAESINLPTNHEFIPLDIRKIFCNTRTSEEYDELYQAFVDKSNLNKYKDFLETSIDYIDKLKFLIGKYIICTNYVGEKHKIKVEAIGYNNFGAVVFKGIPRNMCVDERLPIKVIEPKRRFDEHDPYGEEDWESENEGLLDFFKKQPPEDGKFIRIYDDMIKYIVEDRSKSEMEQKIVNFYKEKLVGKNIKFYGYKVKKSGNSDRDQFAFVLKKVEHLSGSGAHTYYFFSDDDKKYAIYSFSDLVNAEVFKKRNRNITELDPYGEENWEDFNESVDSNSFLPAKIRKEFDPTINLIEMKEFFEFLRDDTITREEKKEMIKEIGDIFRKNPDYLNEIKKLVIGKNVKFQDYIGNKLNYIVKDVSYNSFGVIGFHYGTIYRTMIDETKIVQVFEGKRIYSPVDPYGEEDWEDLWNINEEFNWFKKKKLEEEGEFVSIYDVINNYVKAEQTGEVYWESLELAMDYFKKHLIGKKIFLSARKKNKNSMTITGMGRHKFILRDIKQTQNLADYILTDEKGDQYLVSFTDLVNTYVYKKQNRIYSPADPYGEEEWEE